MRMLYFFLCLSGGRTELANPNNKHYRITGKEKEEIDAILYHTATHDACGYLSEYHYVGPGYNYLGTMLTVFPTCIPQSGRLASLMFWKKLINEPDTPFEYWKESIHFACLLNVHFRLLSFTAVVWDVTQRPPLEMDEFCTRCPLWLAYMGYGMEKPLLDWEALGGYPKQRLKRRLILVRIWFIVTMLWSKFLIECQRLWGIFCSVTFILPSVRRLTPDAQRIRISHDQAMITRVFLRVKLLTCVYSEFSMTFWGNFFYSNWSIEYPSF